MKPLDFTCTIGQFFGGNANPLYLSSGLAGHTGIDERCGYGSPVASYVDGYVYSMYSPEKPASDGYTAVYLLCENGLETYEFSVGHVSKILTTIGSKVRKGDIIAEEGNKGTVYQGDQRITLDMQRAGDQRGSHRHVQKRPVLKVTATSPYKRYLQTATGLLYHEGYYYEYADPSNGYQGCTDFTKPLFDRDLFYGRSGYDVYLLQRVLVSHGLLAPEDCTRFFGTKTLAGVRALQTKYGISPTLGYVGTMTRRMLNQMYPVL